MWVCCVFVRVLDHWLFDEVMMVVVLVPYTSIVNVLATSTIIVDVVDLIFTLENGIEPY